VPVEEPSTASIADICTAAEAGNRTATNSRELGCAVTGAIEVEPVAE